MSRESRRSRVRRKVGALRQRPWGLPYRRLTPIAILSADQVEAVHDAALRILETIGVVVEDAAALDALARTGAVVDRVERRVRFDRGLVRALLAKAPGRFTVTGSAPGRDLVLGDETMAFASVAGPVHVIDGDGARRDGTHADMIEALRVIQGLNTVHLIGGAPVAPLDRPVATRHLDMVEAYLAVTDKVFHVWPRERYRVRDALDLLGAALGLDRADVEAAPRVLGTIVCDSPLRYDGPTIAGLLELAEAGQAIVAAPLALAGGTAPASLAGALAQHDAEALAAIALAQAVRPGTPVVYGGMAGAVDMRTAAPAFGTPDAVRATLALGQLARRHGLPFRAGAVSSGNVVDAQAAYETEMALWGAVLGGAHYFGHAAGWLNGGQSLSLAKMIVDAEMLQMIAEVQWPLDTARDELGIEAMHEVGPGGHFFGAAHTLARYENAFYAPLLSDWRNYETWREAGAEDTAARAGRLWRELAEAEPTALDPAAAEAVAALATERRHAIAASA
ncbi:MAG: methyltransferase [Alphaproteobacteria bacterium]|nr:methyltransferase [Alphaproteobacteria bacterium]